MEEIREELIHQLDNHVAFTIPVFGGIPVAESVVTSWIIMAALVVLSILLTRNLKIIPGRRQILLEMLVGFINDFCKNNIGHHWRSFAPWLGTVAIYLAVSNMAGLFGLIPPTKNINVPVSLAICSTVLVYGAQIRFHGLKGGLKKFAEPEPILLPINFLEILIRPASLSMRLFGNILGAFVVMELVKVVSPVIFPIPFSLYFDVFDGMIQTVVFVFLTTLFVGEAVEE